MNLAKNILIYLMLWQLKTISIKTRIKYLMNRLCYIILMLEHKVKMVINNTKNIEVMLKEVRYQNKKKAQYGKK